MKVIKNLFRLILPPTLNIFYLFKVFNKLKKYLYGNKFELEKNFFVEDDRIYIFLRFLYTLRVLPKTIKEDENFGLFILIISFCKDSLTKIPAAPANFSLNSSPYGRIIALSIISLLLVLSHRKL